MPELVQRDDYDESGVDLLTDMHDDLLPNEGGSFQDDEPEEVDEQEQAIQRERTIVRGAAPLFEQLLEWFNNEIAATDSNRAVAAAASQYGVSREEASVAFEIVADLLMQKKSSLEALRNVHIPT